MSQALVPQAPPSQTHDVPPRWNAALWVVGAVSAALASAGGIGLAVNRLQLDMAVYLMGGRNLVDGQLYLRRCRPSLRTGPRSSGP